MAVDSNDPDQLTHRNVLLELVESGLYPSPASNDTDLHVRELFQSIKECSSTVNPTSPTVYVVNVSLGLCLFMGSGSSKV